MHVRLADESVCIGPPSAKDSYLNCRRSCPRPASPGPRRSIRATASCRENARFAEMVEAHGLTFIGPSPAHIGMMGDKIAAKQAMGSLGVPLVPGSDGAVAGSRGRRARVAARIGYPVLIKAAAGGGGRGMKVAPAPDELEEAWRLARAEAQGRFRQRRRLHGEISRPAPPYRVAGAGRQSRPRRPFRRARLQPAAAASEAAGGGGLPGARRPTSGTRSAKRRPPRSAGSATAMPGHWSSSIRTGSSPSSR